MKLVMIFQITDGCTYECEETLPIEYESIEKAEADFKEKCRVDFSNLKWSDFVFAGRWFNQSNHYDRYRSKEGYKYGYSPPRFLTVEEWFESFKE